jgi:hypothetical protein
VDYGLVGLGGGIVRGVFANDIVYLFEFLAGEGEGEAADETICGLERMEVFLFGIER